MSTRAFISSTCFDLIDLRAELEEDLRSLGICPVLSDRPTSEFKVDPYRNSIETCLANVRDCDIFIIILSRRYGPKLGKVGFRNVSATHLEYLEAVKGKKSIYLYVRDRLDGAYQVWRQLKRQKDKLPSKISEWIVKSDYPLFDIIKSHSSLANDGNPSAPENNWVSIYQSSVDLRKRITFDLRKHFLRGLIVGLSEKKKTPLLIPEILTYTIDKTEKTISIEANIVNVGRSAAIYPFFEIQEARHNLTQAPTTLLPMANQKLNLCLELLKDQLEESFFIFHLNSCYTTIEGFYMCDRTYIELHWSTTYITEPAICRLTEKMLINDQSFHFKLIDGPLMET